MYKLKHTCQCMTQFQGQSNAVLQAQLSTAKTDKEKEETMKELGQACRPCGGHTFYECPTYPLSMLTRCGEIYANHRVNCAQQSGVVWVVDTTQPHPDYCIFNHTITLAEYNVCPMFSH
jgi:hypothetical protein